MAHGGKFEVSYDLLVFSKLLYAVQIERKKYSKIFVLYETAESMVDWLIRTLEVLRAMFCEIKYATNLFMCQIYLYIVW